MQRDRGGRGGSRPGTAGAAEEGFVLVEVIMALGVLAMAVFVTAASLMASGRVESFNERRSQVTQLLATQVEKDDSVAENTTWSSSGPSGLPTTTTYAVGGATVTVTLVGGWCEETAAGTWGTYTGYTPPSPPAPPAPGQIVSYSNVIGSPMAWKERATATWGNGQSMTVANLVPVPAGQPVQPTTNGSCPS